MASYPIQNAPAQLDMIYFWQNGDRYGGLAKSCRYVVRITPSKLMQAASGTTNILPDLTYLCEATEFPGRGLNTVDLRYYGPNFKLPIQTVYEDLSMTFLCRNESRERQIFDDWMEHINPQNTFDFNYRDDYSTTISMYQMSDVGSQHTATYEWSLLDAYPLLVNAQPVTWADDGVQRLTIAFTYSKWTRPGKDQVITTNPVIKNANVIAP